MTATRLMYPKTSINNTGMFLTFRAYDYAGAPVPPGALPDIQNVISGSNRNVELTAENLNGKLTGSYGGRGEDGKNIAPTTSGTGGDANNTGVANISLYLPPKIEYQYGAEWSKISFGALGSTLGAGGGIFGAAAKVALVEVAAAVTSLVVIVLSPKSIAFPLVAIVTYLITLLSVWTESAPPEAKNPRIELEHEPHPLC